MSVLIKGLNMPEDTVMTINIWADGHAYILGKNPVMLHDAAVELPDHGDLIDRDALKDKAEFIGDAFSGRGGYAVWGTDVINAPVVIPAERIEE